MKNFTSCLSAFFTFLLLLIQPACAGASKKPKTDTSATAAVVMPKPAPKQFHEWVLTDTFEPVPSLIIYRYYHQPSGLSVLLSPKLGIDVITYVTSFNVGSRYEVKGRTGLAHLFEHMMFRGTENFAEPFKQLSEWGDSFNAYTSFDITLYHEMAPKKVFRDVVQFESERMRKLQITKEGFDKERGAVVSERKMRTEDSPIGRLFWELHLDAFERHPYKIGPIGWQDDLNATTFEDALAFYKRFYAPNRATIAIVGDFQVDEALNYLNEYYGSFKSEKWVEPKIQQEKPRKKSQRRLINLKSESVIIADAALSIPINDPNVAADSLFCTLLGDSKIGYLSNELVEKGLARSASVSCSPNVDPSLNTVFIVGNPKVPLKDLEAAYDQALKGFAQWLTSDRVEKAKMYYLASQWQSLRDPSNLAEQIARSATMAGDPLFDFKFLTRAQAINLEQVQERFQHFYKAHRTRVIINPSAKNDPFIKR